MVEFILNEKNREECYKLGFFNRPAVENRQDSANAAGNNDTIASSIVSD